MAHDNSGNGTMLLGMVIAVVIAFAGGYMLGNNSQSAAGDAPEAAEAGAAAPAARGGVAGDSDKIPVGNSYVLGKPDAPITVVEFSDFQCPYCSRGGETVKQLQKKYPNDVKVVFKHFPLAFHKEAKSASIAAMAAGEQGKFWEMHDLLFQNQKQMKGADMKELTTGFAKQLGLDVAKFQKDFDKPEFGQTVDADMKLGSSLGVRGTPHFFVNGERVSGAQPITKFEEIVKKQLGEAKQMLAAGTTKKDLYAKMVAKNFKAAEAPQPRGQQAQRIEMVPVRPNTTTAKGNTKDPLVTIVEFSDFQCPFCTRVNPTLDQVMKKYGKDVRIVFKQNPLPFHKEAGKASEAALAAGEQGKFWEMHDLLFENQKKMKGADMMELTSGLAQQLGLNMPKFKAYMESGKGAAIVKEDLALGQKVGARGTPNFFVNGVQLVGAKPFGEFDALIGKQIELAKKIKTEKKLSGDELYAAVVDHNKKNAPKAAAPPTPQQPEPKVDVNKLKVNGSYTKGPKNAKVTIYEFSDFQCPYCSRANASIQEVLKAYPKDVQVVFKAFPLPFHKEAEPAHRAALAAGKQGKFWEMHDKFFANQKALKTPNIWNQYAQEIGLNMDKFQKDFDSAEIKKQVQDEMAMGKTVGVRGTPAFFVNGNRIVGAQPFAKFKEVIDAELK